MEAPAWESESRARGTALILHGGLSVTSFSPDISAPPSAPRRELSLPRVGGGGGDRGKLRAEPKRGRRKQEVSWGVLSSLRGSLPRAARVTKLWEKEHSYVVALSIKWSQSTQQ